jgi:hypothetical protein
MDGQDTKPPGPREFVWLQQEIDVRVRNTRWRILNSTWLSLFFQFSSLPWGRERVGTEQRC